MVVRIGLMPLRPEFESQCDFATLIRPKRGTLEPPWRCQAYSRHVPNSNHSLALWAGKGGPVLRAIAETQARAHPARLL